MSQAAFGTPAWMRVGTAVRPSPPALRHPGARLPATLPPLTGSGTLPILAT